MSIVIGPMVGKGNTADVFALDDTRVVKLFVMGYPKESVEKEYRNSELFSQMNISSPKSYEMITYGDRFGIVYDKVNGNSLLDILLESMNIGTNGTGNEDKWIDRFAILHKKILSRRALAVLDCKCILRENICATNILSKQQKEKLLLILKSLPEGDSLCHGDYHFGNILVSQQNCIVIDFMNVCKGDRCFDIARTIYLTEFTPVPDCVPGKDEIVQFKKHFSGTYLKKMGIKKESISDWLTVIVAARLSELGEEQVLERNTVLQYLSQKGI